MLRRFSVNFALFSMALDTVLVASSLWLAQVLRPGLSQLSFAQTLGQSEAVAPAPLYVLFPAVWLAVMLLFNLYDGRRNLRVVNELSNLTLAAGLATIASVGLLYLSFRDVSRLLFATFVISSFLFMATWRLLLRALQRWRGFRVSTRKVLIIGTGQLGKQVRAQVEEYASLGLNFTGFLDDEGGGKQVLGYLKDARKVVRKRHPDDVIIALPSSAYRRINALLSDLHDLPVRTWVIPDYFSLALHKAQVEDFAGLPMLDLRAPALSDSQRLFKRAFDVAVVIITLPFALPIMLACAAAIWLQDRRPILLNQQRVGENGRLFTMYKFRTMQVNAGKLRLEKDGFLQSAQMIRE